jgi:hypothetical protein
MPDTDGAGGGGGGGGRYYHGGAALDGKLFVVGGYTAAGVTSALAAYDPWEGTWTKVPT